MSAIKDRNTIAPAVETAGQVEGLLEMLLEARAADESVMMSLSGHSDSNHFVVVPQEVVDLVGRVVASLHAGQPISVLPHDLKVTTQEAADLLGLSRPTVIKLINTGVLPCEMVGSHRRLAISDVIAFRNSRREQVQAMLDATALDDEIDDVEALQRALRAAKAASGTASRMR